METVRIRDGKKSDPGSGINIPDPPHCPLSNKYGISKRITKRTVQCTYHADGDDDKSDGGHKQIPLHAGMQARGISLLQLVLYLQ